MSNNDSTVVIRLDNLTKRFGAFTAVNKVNLDIRRGEVVGFLGPNGAGKSTTMKMIAGLLQPTEGRVLVNHGGELISLTRNNKDVLLEQVGFLVENPAFYDHMTPRQILKYFAKLKGYPRKAVKGRVEEVVSLVKMDEWIDRPIKEFSKGMRQKIGLVSALVHDPDVLVLDEPQTGLDPKARKEMRDLIGVLKERGKTIFLSSHILYDISEVADRVAIISHGELIACDTVDKLEAQAKHSIIKVETLEKYTPQAAVNVCASLEPKIKPLTGLENGDFTIQYDLDAQLFEILFDGSEEAQYEILEKLLAEGLKVIEFSVPKANLLEELYVTLVEESEKANSEYKRRQI
ncbi:MAG: ABC transporter ATP-binding protein [Promethearchaeota archaeon]